MASLGYAPRLFTAGRPQPHWALAAAFFVVLPVQYWLVWTDWYGLYSIFIPVYAFLLMPIISALRGDPDRYLIRIAELQWALMISVFCVSHVPALLSLQIPGYEGRNVLLIAFLVVVVQLSDVLQYVWGKLIGRRRIAPLLSPSKTVEGFVGGVSSATLAGAGLGFLWFNAYPAEVFMGDVGALALGAALGVVAVIVRQEIVLFVMGGVFVMETLSVMLQVGSYKLRGKRIFRMAPLHHHYELKGWKETQVVVRFWIITMMLVLVGLSTLKLR